MMCSFGFRLVSITICLQGTCQWNAGSGISFINISKMQYSTAFYRDRAFKSLFAKTKNPSKMEGRFFILKNSGNAVFFNFSIQCRQSNIHKLCRFSFVAFCMQQYFLDMLLFY